MQPRESSPFVPGILHSRGPRHTEGRWDRKTAHRVHCSFLFLVSCESKLQRRGWRPAAHRDCPAAAWQGEFRKESSGSQVIKSKMLGKGMIQAPMAVHSVAGAGPYIQGPNMHTIHLQVVYFLLQTSFGLMLQPKLPSVSGEHEVHSWSTFDLVSSERNPLDALPSLRSPGLNPEHRKVGKVRRSVSEMHP